MKTIGWMFLGTMLSLSLCAQPAADPAATGDSKAKPAKKAAAAPAKPAAPEKPVILVPGPGTITGDNVNVRGKAAFVGEIIARLKKGDKVTVVEQVIRENPKPDEPSQWAKINYPSNTPVWVHASYIDPTNKVVLPNRLNVRAGPGENYSVVGLIEKGTAVKEGSRKGNWVEIEAPANAYAFVAARFIEQEGTAAEVPTVVSIAPPVEEPPTTTTAVPESPTVVTPAPEVATTTPPEEPPGVTPEPEPADAPPPPPEEPLPPRIVSHEGVVRDTVSIQAPTRFALVSPETGRTINYLYTTSTNLNLARYKGRHIIVTGEEGLDRRWRNTPVLTIQRIQVLK